MGVGVYNFTEKSVTKMKGSTVLALRGGGWGVKFPEKKHYVTFEWPLKNEKCNSEKRQKLQWNENGELNENLTKDFIMQIGKEMSSHSKAHFAH